MSDFSRLAFLVETVKLEAQHLCQTDQRLFQCPFDTERAAGLRVNVDEAERTALVPLLAEFGEGVVRFSATRGMLPPSSPA